MSTIGNTLDDFPAERFTIFVLCNTCGHDSPLDRTKVPDGALLQDLPRVLLCRACGSRQASIQIVYTGAGGFHYGENSPTDASPSGTSTDAVPTRA